MKRKLFIVPIERLDNRYTAQWFDYIPSRLMQEFPEYEIVNIDGNMEGYLKPKPGAFFDFGATMTYKNSQAQTISKMFTDGVIQPNDILFFTDAWNPTIHTVKYISELNSIPVKIAGIFHAGWYDPTDILGFTIKNSEWVSHLEKSMYSAMDMVFFGTEQHKEKFFKCHSDLNSNNSIVCGYPLDYLEDISKLGTFGDKKKIVIFPHRLNEDKAPFIFDYIKDHVNVRMQRMDIEFVKTQELNLSKEEYYKKLNEAMVIFSANKHENLGIGTFEAMMLGAHPMLIDKLSYKEMYDSKYKYPEISGFYEKLYAENYWRDIANRIVSVIDSYDIEMYDNIINDSEIVFKKYFSCDAMIDHLRDL